MTTFLASVLNLSPLAWTIVIVVNPLLLTLMSRTTPALPAWVPATTLQGAPSRSFAGGLSLGFFAGGVFFTRVQ